MEKYYSGYAKQLKKRKGKPWQAVLRYKNIDGKTMTISKMLPEATGKREANRMAEEWRKERNELESLSATFDKEKTVLEVVSEYMDYQYLMGEIEESTYHNRTSSLLAMIKPYIGDYTFVTLDRIAINSWLSKLNSKGYSQGTIGIAFYTVRKVYEYYYELGELTRNPFLGIKPPKKGAPKVTHLTQEQMKYFLSCADKENPKFKLVCYLAFYAGLRRGEICGLRWRDVDLESGTISINTSIGIAEKEYTKQPKNKSSIRTFPIVPQLLEELKKNVEEPNYFVTGNGTDFYNPLTLAKHFKDFVKKNHLVDAYGKTITLHALRHNLAAVGISSKMDIASLSQMMGHSSRAMTLDTYGDATKDAMVVATEKLGKKFDDQESDD